jgi:hypothetical protein
MTTLPLALAALCCLAAAATAAPRAMTITVTPAATGRQMVRASIPLPRCLLRPGEMLAPWQGGTRVDAALRVLTWHPAKPRSARRAILTFPYTFRARRPVRLTLRPEPARRAAGQFPLAIDLTAEAVTVQPPAGPRVTARVIAPPRTSGKPPRLETVERNAYYLWQRVHVPDPQWPRVIEVRADALGQVVLIARLQRNAEGDVRAPDLGWEVQFAPTPSSVEFASEGARPVELVAGRPRMDTAWRAAR